MLAAALPAADPPPAAPAPPPPVFPDRVVAKGTGFEVKQSQLDESFNMFKAKASPAQPFPEDRRDFYLARILDRLISTKLLVARANEADKAKANEATDKFVADTKRKLSSDEMFRLQLKAMGLTPEIFRERALEQAVCEEVLNREVRSGITNTDAEVRKYYDDNPKQFEQPEQVRAAHVLISTKDPAATGGNPGEKRDLPAAQKEVRKKLAENILARARKGEDFAKLAAEFSDDPGSKNSGGEYTFARGRMVPEFEAAAFGGQAGQVCDLVTTVFGYHIIKVLEKIPARKLEFDKVSAKIRDQLKEEQLQQQMPAYLQKLRAEAKVEILDETLKVIPTAQPTVTPVMPPTPKK